MTTGGDCINKEDNKDNNLGVGGEFSIKKYAPLKYLPFMLLLVSCNPREDVGTSRRALCYLFPRRRACCLILLGGGCTTPPQ